MILAMIIDNKQRGSDLETPETLDSLTAAFESNENRETAETLHLTVTQNTSPDPYYIMRNLAPGSHVEAAYFPEVKKAALAITTEKRGLFGRTKRIRQTIAIDHTEIARLSQWLAQYPEPEECRPKRVEP
jgi:hypothetical protein